MQPIHILGTGAMACLWGSYFSNDTTITFISRQRNESQFVYSVAPNNKQIIASLQTAHSTETIQYLIIATKAFDALNAINSVKHRLAKDAEILVLQNGMGSQQAIANAFPELTVYACSSTEGAYKKSPNELVHAGVGINTIGPLSANGSNSNLSTWLPQEKYQWVDDIEPVLWKKLVVNSAINPLTVIFKCQNGKLLENPESLTLMQNICHEMDNLTNKMNLNLGKSFKLAESVCKQTAQNYSSMFQDAKHHRQTEIDYITGYLLEKCQSLGISCPNLQGVYDKIQTLQLGPS